MIDWRMTAESIHNLVRGLTHPYVGAHFVYHEKIVKVWRTAVANNAPLNLEPGKILAINNDGVLVKAGMEAIRLYDSTPKIDLQVGDYL